MKRERRVRIGNIGGRGGSISTYNIQIEFDRGNPGGLPAVLSAGSPLRIDTAKVVEVTPEAIGRAGALQSERGG
ncbi:MAG: hypothetical protein ACR2H4_13560 [Pyrinomonadaceae bacterium]